MQADDERLERLGEKMIRRLVLPLALLTFVNAIDRVNVSFAGHAMSMDLGLSPTSFGAAVSAFFVAYLLFQYPHAALLRRLGIRRWLLGTVLLWGLSGVILANVRSSGEFIAARFLLGIAEAGFAPGATWFITHWLPANVRAKAMATVLSAVPLSLVIGGPLCGWMLGWTNPLGLPAWRWMFLLQAAPNFLLALLSFFYFTDDVSRSRWLAPGESEMIKRVSKTAAVQENWREIGGDRRVWRCALTWLFVMTGSYALIFWLPQLVRQMDLGGNEFQIGALSALPQVGLIVGMLANGRHSDRSGERRWHVGLAAMFAGVALLASGLSPPGWIALLFLILASAGIGGAQSVFWSVPASMGIGSGRVSIGAIALVSMAGTAGGIIGPLLIGVLKQSTGGFVAALLLLSALLVLGGVLIAPLGIPRAKLEEAPQ